MATAHSTVQSDRLSFVIAHLASRSGYTYNDLIAEERRTKLVSGEVGLRKAKAMGAGRPRADREKLAIHTADEIQLRREVEQIALAAESLRMDDFIAVLSVLPATGRIIRVQAVLAAEISPLNNRLLCLICKVLQIGERIHEAWLRLFDLNVDGLIELLVKAIGVPRRPHLRIDV